MIHPWVCTEYFKTFTVMTAVWILPITCCLPVQKRKPGQLHAKKLLKSWLLHPNPCFRSELPWKDLFEDRSRSSGLKSSDGFFVLKPEKPLFYNYAAKVFTLHGMVKGYALQVRSVFYLLYKLPLHFGEGWSEVKTRHSPLTLSVTAQYDGSVIIE